MKWEDELRDMLIITVGYFLRDLKWFLLNKLRQSKKRYKPHRSSDTGVSGNKPVTPKRNRGGR